MRGIKRTTLQQHTLNVKNAIESELYLLLIEPENKLLQKSVCTVSLKHAQLTNSIAAFVFDGRAFCGQEEEYLCLVNGTKPLGLHPSLVEEFSPLYRMFKASEAKVKFVTGVIIKAIHLTFNTENSKFEVCGVPHELAKLLPENAWYYVPENAEKKFICLPTDRNNLKFIQEDLNYFLSLRYLV